MTAAYDLGAVEERTFAAPATPRRSSAGRVHLVDDPARPVMFGTPVDALTMEQTVARVEQLIARGGVHQHVSLNAAKVVQMVDDPSIAEIVRRCDLVSADGQAVVWASRLLGKPLPERVAGIDLMERLLARAAALGWGVYFLGATDPVVRETVARETEAHPGLRVAGFKSGYWTPDMEQKVVAEIAESGATLLLVAMPTPRKERFLAEHLVALGVPFAMGVGGSFDVVAGRVSRAPQWMRKIGMEWSWRLVKEPRRMFKRYLVGNTRFIWLALAERVGLRRSVRPSR